MKWRKIVVVCAIFVGIGGIFTYRYVAGGWYERWKLERSMSEDYRYQDYVERSKELGAIVGKVQDWELNLIDKSVNGGSFSMKDKDSVTAKGVYKDKESISNAPKDLTVDVTYFYDIANHRALQHIRVNSEEKNLHKNTTVVYDRDGKEVITYD